MNHFPAVVVVVGIDTSQNSRTALKWAVGEAYLRTAGLRIGHSWSMPLYRLPEASEHDTADESRMAALSFLEGAAEEVRRRLTGLRVESGLLEEAPIDGPLRMATADGGKSGRDRPPQAQPVPDLPARLGQRERRRPFARSRHPRARRALPRPEWSGRRRGHTGCVEPVEFAFAEAERRGAPLKVVRTWSHAPAFPDGLVVPRETNARTSLVIVGAHRKHAHQLSLPVGRVPHQGLHLADSPGAVIPGPGAHAPSHG